MPGSNTVPPLPMPPKQPATAHVSVLVGRPNGPVGWTVMFIRAVVEMTPTSATWMARLTGEMSVWSASRYPAVVAPSTHPMQQERRVETAARERVDDRAGRC